MHTLTVPARSTAHHHRLAWFVVAAAALTVAILEVVQHDVSVWLVVLFALGPDLSFLAGAGQASAPGQLPPRAIPVYNLVHRPVWSLLLAAASSFGLVPGWCLVAGVAWLAHISLDRSMGYGLRTEDGWQRG